MIENSLDTTVSECYSINKLHNVFRAGCKSLPAVIAREPKGMIRCDSGADSIVWMREDDGTVILIDECSV